MFYSQSLLSRKGPLGNVWIAAFCFKKLKKDQIADTDISSSIDKIMPEVQISYRVLAQLLLGIVRIFSKKVDYLYHDCNEALTNIRKSFMPSQQTVQNEAIGRQQHIVIQTKKKRHVPDQRVDTANEAMAAAPTETMRATYHHVTITVPERFELDSFDLDISDEGETAKFHEHSRIQDDLVDERDQSFFLNEQYHRETVTHAQFDSACFTPVDDVLPSHVIDIDFEISEYYNLDSLEVAGENIQGDSQHIEENGSFAGLVAKGSLGFNIHDVESDHQVRPQKMLSSDPDKNIQLELSRKLLEPIILREETTSPTKTHDKSHYPCDLGLASPKFTVRTPAKREHLSMRRKRKNLFDEIIVLSNETLRQGIHDASSLICKRRRAPHTFLDAWKADRIANLQHNFIDPLVPCTSSELKALFQNKSTNYLSAQKTVAEYHTESVNAQNGISNKSAEFEETLQEKIHETTVTERFIDEARISKLSELETNKPSSLETSDTDLDLIDRELGSHEESCLDQDNRWSVRTRAVAQYLCSRLLDIKNREQKGFLSLARILEGKTRRKCARFFYETLILKGCGFIDVKQDCPYGDIVISAGPQLEAGTEWRMLM